MTSSVRSGPVVGLTLALTVLLSVAIVACTDDTTTSRSSNGGSPDVGAELIANVGCGSCHTVPGVDGADGRLAPPLIHWSKRAFVAGQLSNTSSNLQKWLLDPQAIDPGTAMPNLQLTEEEARDIAAYLMEIE